MNNWRWPNFSRTEVACSHCLKDGVKDEAMDALQALRIAQDRPLRVNSGYRCPEHNVNVGGVKDSFHVKGMAFDISIRGMNESERLKLMDDAIGVGFTGLGFYETFLHVDIGPPRSWGNW